MTIPRGSCFTVADFARAAAACAALVASLVRGFQSLVRGFQSLVRVVQLLPLHRDFGFCTIELGGRQLRVRRLIS
jgi:hypothetical protein